MIQSEKRRQQRKYEVWQFNLQNIPVKSNLVYVVIFVKSFPIVGILKLTVVIAFHEWINPQRMNKSTKIITCDIYRSLGFRLRIQSTFWLFDISDYSRLNPDLCQLFWISYKIALMSTYFWLSCKIRVISIFFYSRVKRTYANLLSSG